MELAHHLVDGTHDRVPSIGEWDDPNTGDYLWFSLFSPVGHSGR